MSAKNAHDEFVVRVTDPYRVSSITCIIVSILEIAAAIQKSRGYMRTMSSGAHNNRILLEMRSSLNQFPWKYPWYSPSQYPAWYPA